jgi:hypothetical protein
MKRRVLIAKKRGRLVGAAVGGLLLGPVGALAGAVLNSKTDYYEPEKPPLPLTLAETESKAKADLKLSRLGRRAALILCVAIVAIFVWMMIYVSYPHGG